MVPTIDKCSQFGWGALVDGFGNKIEKFPVFAYYQERDEVGMDPFPNYHVMLTNGNITTVSAWTLRRRYGLDIPETPSYKEWKNAQTKTN